ncbi:hypothetical protein SAMN05216480_10456 [Pustulibacterium marinum]|uniref:Lipoprotein n=1 Tax=Pustulibacterium marinum TaxID=1224947 RepID=A0A1I7GB52_9FLAO|nr:hypothetical protein [Pustulibacterium marinum]SFU45672.1 hypothetical protein SAMN05216480_10456 [Pustulibacterium marinum]
MIRTFLFLASLVVLVSCDTHSYTHKSNSWKPKPLHIVCPSDDTHRTFIPDFSVGNLSLSGKETARSKGNTLYSETLVESCIVFQTEKQGIKAFKIKYSKGLEGVCPTIKAPKFTTESGVKLGMSIAELKAIKGKPDSITTDKGVVFEYRTTAAESELLAQQQQKAYYASYRFFKGYLHAFEFGFL